MRIAQGQHTLIPLTTPMVTSIKEKEEELLREAKMAKESRRR